ncbi:hypothetical protein [Streptomyces atratus]|uniref:hypothetical protein n=1 Tax=Streptomyces atratus TaxID=1893 RepID=UPI0036645C96
MTTAGLGGQFAAGLFEVLSCEVESPLPLHRPGWAPGGVDVLQLLASFRRQGAGPQLYMTLVQKAHAILCDASRDGVRLYYPGGDVEHVTPQVRADVHAAITTSLERDWPPYIQGLIDRGALQAR